MILLVSSVFDMSKCLMWKRHIYSFKFYSTLSLQLVWEPLHFSDDEIVVVW